MKTLNQFLENANKLHNNKYDYSEVKYINSHTPVLIKCPQHGAFSQRPYAHLQGQGCKTCGLLNRKSNKKTTSQFLEEARNKWNDKFDYSNTIYINKNYKIKYLCPIHGEQEQYPYLHLKNGCQYCSGRGISKHTIKSFIAKANEAHNGTYDYHEVEFNKITDKVTIHCRIHGPFIQKASDHINLGSGCQKCNGGIKDNHKDFINKSIAKHGIKFDYSKTNYTSSHEKVKFICPIHGEFEQFAYIHLQCKHACMHCASSITSSAAERDIVSFIKEHYIGKVENNDRNILGKMEIDILLPELKIGIEYNGNFWHREKVVGKTKHVDKVNLAENKGIKLIQIFEHEWENKQDIVKSRILSYIGKNKRVFARKTKIIVLNTQQKNNFLEHTHIQGKDNSSIYLGLEHNNELVACMTFGKPRFNTNYTFELIRYSSDLNTNVIGGAGKLLYCFKQMYKGSIISYADRRWSTGNLYNKLGFELNGTSSPGYFYYNLNNKQILSRVKCQKHKLKHTPFYDDDLTEKEIMELNGYERIYDAGNTRWVMK